MKHPHAENMVLYAKDALETDKPWDRWEYHFHGWRPCVAHPNWDDNTLYRRKPQPIKKPYIKIGSRWVPEPMREGPEYSTTYFVVGVTQGKAVEQTWYDSVSVNDHNWLKAGICHLTREAAEQHLAALQKLHAQEPTMLTDEEARKC